MPVGSKFAPPHGNMVSFYIWGHNNRIKWTLLSCRIQLTFKGMILGWTFTSIAKRLLLNLITRPGHSGWRLRAPGPRVDASCYLTFVQYAIPERGKLGEIIGFEPGLKSRISIIGSMTDRMRHGANIVFGSKY